MLVQFGGRIPHSFFAQIQITPHLRSTLPSPRIYRLAFSDSEINKNRELERSNEDHATHRKRLTKSNVLPRHG